MNSDTRAFIAFGANLGDAVQAYADAVRAIDALPRTRVQAQSSLYRSAPVGVHGHPDYINAAVEVATALTPTQLLDALLAIEISHGRTRGGEVSPRAMDLDLLLFGDECIDSDRLKVPHPRMHHRAFVLLPLAEIDCELEIPGKGRVVQLLESVANQVIVRLSHAEATGMMENSPT